MSKYDDAIYEIEKIRNTGSFRDSQMEALDLAIEASQEKAEREKGCEYCKMPSTNYLATIDYDGAETRLFFDVIGNNIRVFDEEMPGLSDGFTIHFCPMCGRKLGEK